MLVTVTAEPPARLAVDVIGVPIFEGESVGDEWLHSLDAASGGEVTAALARREITGTPFEQLTLAITDRDWQPRRLILLGAGPASDFSTARARLLASALTIAARSRHFGAVAFVVRGQPGADLQAQPLAEGAVLGEFDPAGYKTTDRNDTAVDRFIIVTPVAIDRSDLERAVRRGVVLAESTNLARDLINEPGSALPPRVFADRVAAIAAEVHLPCEVADERRIAELNMGAFLGVARGSEEPPRLIVLRCEPAANAAREPRDPGSQRPILALVGKGITFDSGGISLKPGDGMERMKDDMSGGAAVVGAMRALALLEPRVRVLGLIPATENMPSGRALKPGDILRAADGKTIEVLNTDAEGRLILADALVYARQLGATHMVDIATLTGAVVVALGKIASGLFGGPADWIERVRAAGDRAGERFWPMPLYDEYREQLKSDIADLANVGGRPAGSITAAMFLKQFAGDVPWAHLDIAGTAWNDETKAYLPKGPTGVAVRTLAELALGF